MILTISDLALVVVSSAESHETAMKILKSDIDERKKGILS